MQPASSALTRAARLACLKPSTSESRPVSTRLVRRSNAPTCLELPHGPELASPILHRVGALEGVNIYCRTVSALPLKCEDVDSAEVTSHLKSSRQLC